jgi:hypothetical protein
MTRLFELLGVVEMLETLEGFGVLAILGVTDDRRLDRTVARLSWMDPTRIFRWGRVREWGRRLLELRLTGWPSTGGE